MSTTTPRRPATTAVDRTSFTVLLFTAALLAGDASRILAQATPEVVAGSRVRITAPAVGLHGAVGTVRETTDGALVVQFQYPRGVGTVDRADIARLEVSIRSERRALRGLGRGLLIGAGSGVVIGLASGDDPSGFLSFSAEEKALALGIVGGLSGGIIGLVVGVAIQHEAWAAAYPQGFEATILPVFGEDGVGLNLGFTLTVG